MTQGNAPGTYVLSIELSQGCSISVGSLGAVAFEKGYYLYVGSALSGLRSRLQRHLRPNKRLHWHIDYLLQRGRIQEIWYHAGPEPYECAWARALHTIPGLEPSKAPLGASDCDCHTHLFHSKNDPSFEAFQKAVDEYASMQKLKISLEDPTEVDL